jgi:hypothetical protein
MRNTLVFLLVSSSLAAFAQDDEDSATERAAALDLDNDSIRCIQAVSIRRIRAIDDSTIAFYLPGGRVYLNYLPRRCPSAARNQRFAYETNGGRICRMDRISVIYDRGGQDIGLSCPLGDFYPAEAESVDLMIEAASRGGAASPVTAESVELPPEDEVEAEPADSQR